MSKITSVGTQIGDIQKETGLNTRRVSESFPLLVRNIKNLSTLEPYQASFKMTPGSGAYLNLKIDEVPISCTVNPPLLSVSTTGYFNGSEPGSVTSLTGTTNNHLNLDDPARLDFIIAGGSIQVPVDGCYSVLWRSGAWGVGYYSNKYVIVAITHNGYQIRTITGGPTGVISILGPGIYVYVPASPVYAVVECKAGDTIGAYLYADNIGEPLPWVAGTGLTGFWDTPNNGTTLNVTLVAEAEA